MQVTDTLSSSAMSYNANLLGNPTLPSGQRTPARYFDANMVQAPTDVTKPFCNAARNSARSSPLYQLDLSAQKEFPFGERHFVQFRAEFFSALNKTNFSPPSGNISNSGFGTVTGTFPARQIQFALKLAF
jgi:hypothetical protein